MESGIFALIGVIVGVVISSPEKIKLNFAKKKRAENNEEETDKLTITKQWENLLNYDGRGN